MMKSGIFAAIMEGVEPHTPLRNMSLWCLKKTNYVFLLLYLTSQTRVPERCVRLHALANEG